MLYVKAINQYNNVFLFLPPVTCLGFSSTFCTFLGLYSYATCPEKSILNYTLLLLYLPFLCFIFLHSTDKEKEKKERKKSEVAQLCPTLRPHGHQTPPSMGFSRQEYWSGLPFPSPGNLPTQGSNPGLPHCRKTLSV